MSLDNPFLLEPPAVLSFSGGRAVTAWSWNHGPWLHGFAPPDAGTFPPWVDAEEFRHNFHHEGKLERRMIVGSDYIKWRTAEKARRLVTGGSVNRAENL